MVIKSFNVQADTYAKFSAYCKDHGISMSRQIQLFMQSIVEEEPEVREEYLAKLEVLRKGKFIRIDDFDKHYGL